MLIACPLPKNLTDFNGFFCNAIYFICLASLKSTVSILFELAETVTKLLSPSVLSSLILLAYISNVLSSLNPLTSNFPLNCLLGHDIYVAFPNPSV